MIYNRLFFFKWYLKSLGIYEYFFLKLNINCIINLIIVLEDIKLLLLFLFKMYILKVNFEDNMLKVNILLGYNIEWIFDVSNFK